MTARSDPEKFQKERFIVDQDKKPDPMSEERFFPENVQRDITKKDIPEVEKRKNLILL